jgi:hypothetical protein
MSSVDRSEATNMSARIRIAQRGATLTLTLPHGLVLRVGTWRYNPTGVAQVNGAYVRAIQCQVWRNGAREGMPRKARGIHVERWNRVARADCLTLPYARCEACGRYAHLHEPGTLRLVPTFLRTGYPRVTCG